MTARFKTAVFIPSIVEMSDAFAGELRCVRQPFQRKAGTFAISMKHISVERVCHAGKQP